MRLYLLGWTQQEIADVMGLTHQRVSQIASKLKNLSLLAKSDFEDGKSIGEICRYHSVDEVLAWALILEGKSDLERLTILSDRVEGLNCKPRPYDVWNLSTYVGHVG